MSFTHLHLHTSYSLLDGAGRINDMVDRVKELKQDSMAITDHGVMYGAIDFFTTCIKKGIKPIIGSEIYVVKSSRFEKNKNDEERFHLILLCENDIGYKNLIKIVSTGFTEGFYYRPRVDYETLSKYHEGLICLTACLAGEVPKALVNGNYEEAKLRAENLKNIFGANNFFIELQNHGISDELKILPDLIRLAKDIDVSYVATNDVHYTLKEDSFAHDCLICLQTGKKITDENRMRYEKEKFYITSESEMLDAFSFCKDAVTNTKLIADRCNVHLEFTKSAYNDLISDIDKSKSKGIIDGDENVFKEMIRHCEYHVPIFKVPDGFSNETYLTHLVWEGVKKRYKNIDDVKNRVEYELSMIIKMGFVDYFLIVYDYIHYAKTHNIPVGPGRGSAVGSIVAYSLEITDIDPIQYGLFFERFLNPERVSMPDIDTDFCIFGREDVINYVKEIYGKSHVAQIVTFGTLAAKMVLKDMGRVLDVPKITEITNLIAERPMIDNQHKANLYKMLNADIENFNIQDRDNVIEFRTRYNESDDIKKVVDISIRLEGIPRNASVHASGVLIAPSDISDFVPFARGKAETSIEDKELGKKESEEQILVTEYDMTTLEKLGLLKMDFLGLRNVTAIKDCIELIKKNRSIDVDLKTIPYDDKNVYKMISKGETLGVFQLESQGMTSFMTRLKPTVLEDLIAGISLYRPGPMDFIPKYIDGKRNENEIKYDTDKLKHILKPTYGCIVYQEQVMQIVQDLAGFTLGRADEVRRAMAKKKAEKLTAERKNFISGNSDLKIDGCIKRGVSEKIGNKIFDDLTQFASYAFNKSHAAAYAVLAYQTAYLKYYYRAEFFTSICNSVIFKRDKLAEYVAQVLLNGIKILPVDINKSYDMFSVEGDSIRMGFASVKRVGASISSAIIRDREKNGEYKSFKDAIKRIVLIGGNKTAIEALIFCGAFDDFSLNRNQKMHIYPTLVDRYSVKSKESIIGEMTIFDYMKESGIDNIDDNDSDYDLIKEYGNVKEFTEDDKLQKEKEYTGIYLSGHPIIRYKDYIEKYTNCTSKDFININDDELLDVDNVKKFKDGDQVTIIGIINSVKKLKTKRTNEDMAVIRLSDLYGEFSAIVFPKKFADCKNDLFEGNKVYIKGNYSVDDRDNVGKIYANKIVNMDTFSNELNKASFDGKVKILLGFNDEKSYIEKIDNVNNVLKKYAGNDYVKIVLIKEKKAKILNNFKVKCDEILINELKELLGDNRVKTTHEK